MNDLNQRFQKFINRNHEASLHEASLSSIIDLQKLQQKEQYDDLMSDVEDDLSMQRFNEDEESISFTITSNIMKSSSKRSSAFENSFIFISHERSYYESSKFELVLNL